MLCNMVCRISCNSGPYIPHFVSKTVVKMVIFWNINPKYLQTCQQIYLQIYIHVFVEYY